MVERLNQSIKHLADGQVIRTSLDELRKYED